MPTDINLLYTESQSLTIPKQYTLDFDKFNADTDINSKLNAIMAIFRYVNFTLQENYIDEDIRKYLKEM